jgi:cell wall-associated NlpC family hydrolase
MKTRAWTLLIVLSALLGAKAWSTGARVGTDKTDPDAVGEAADGAWLPGAAAMAVRTAEHYVGTPYRWGGESPDGGFDCSGFVRHVYALNGVALPRVTVDQARFGREIEPQLANLEPGDLLFFAPAGGEIDHVAIYSGDGRIIHSSSALGGVRVDPIDRDGWYATHLVTARRVAEP